MKPTRQEQRRKTAFLALEDGSVFRGYAFGASCDAVGEVVFNTGMTGYQEIMSDPSYAGQFVVMTSPEIGNTGVNDADMEADRYYANGLIVHELNSPSSWRSENSLTASIESHAKPALGGIDTRGLTLKIRSCGSLKAYMAVSGSISEKEAIAKAAAWEGLDGQDYVSRVTCDQPWVWNENDSLTRFWGMTDSLPPADMRLVAYDFGIKHNILRHLRMSGFSVTVVPARTPADEVLAMKPDGVFLSNGPGDPAALGYAVDAARMLIGKIPLMGICLGHQILAQATGAETYRLKFGHHGCNHPVKHLQTGKVEITSQNHNFAVNTDTIDMNSIEITHINLNDGTVEGLAHRRASMFSVQYHPEAGPGPHDSNYLFRKFRDIIAS